MNIRKFVKEDMGIRVRFTEDGAMELNCHDIAYGLFLKVEFKNEKEYESIRWSRLEEYTEDKNFAHYWSKEISETSWLPEGNFYKLIMRMRGIDNEKVNKFQDWVAFEVLPSLRKNGAYVDEKFEDKKLQEKYLKIVNLTMSLCRSREHALSSISKEIFNGNRAALKRKLVEDGYISEDMTTILKGHFKDHSGVVRPILLQKNTQIMVDGEIKTRHNITATGYGFAHFMYKYNNIEIK